MFINRPIDGGNSPKKRHAERPKLAVQRRNTKQELVSLGREWNCGETTFSSVLRVVFSPMKDGIPPLRLGFKSTHRSSVVAQKGGHVIYRVRTAFPDN